MVGCTSTPAAIHFDQPGFHCRWKKTAYRRLEIPRPRNCQPQWESKRLSSSLGCLMSSWELLMPPVIYGGLGLRENSYATSAFLDDRLGRQMGLLLGHRAFECGGRRKSSTRSGLGRRTTIANKWLIRVGCAEICYIRRSYER